MNPAEPLRHHMCFLDVGGGSSAVLIAEENSVVVSDFGWQITFSVFLRVQSITHVNSIQSSHVDPDHIGSLAGIPPTQEIPTGRVHFNSDASKHTNAWNDLPYARDCAHNAGSLRFSSTLSENSSRTIDRSRYPFLVGVLTANSVTQPSNVE